MHKKKIVSDLKEKLVFYVFLFHIVGNKQSMIYKKVTQDCMPNTLFTESSNYTRSYLIIGVVHDYNESSMYEGVSQAV